MVEGLKYNRYVYAAAVNAGAKGIVVAPPRATSDAALGGAKDAFKKVVVITKPIRVGSGIVNHEGSDDKDKLVTFDSLNPQRARILLMLALTKTKGLKKIQ